MNKFLLMMLGTFLLDVTWAMYTIHMTRGNAYRAGGLAAVLYILGGTLVITYTDDSSMLLPAALGAFLGTVVGVKKMK